MPDDLSACAFVDQNAPGELTIIQKMTLQKGAIILNIDIESFKEQLGYFVVGNEQVISFLDMEGNVLFSLNDLEEAASEIVSSDIPETEGAGRWLRLGKSRYFVHCAGNDTYHLRILSMIPSRVFQQKLLDAAGSWIMVTLFALFAVLIIAYVTTRRNFEYFDQVIDLFSRAEQGDYPSPERNARIRDEYDLILNNIISLFLGTMRLNAELKEKQYEEEAVRLCALQTQINPHFLFNTLQTIQLEEKNNGNAGAGQLTENLADILKYALTDPYRHPSLEEEIKYLKKYAAIQKSRFGDDFIIYYEVEPDVMDRKVFPMMLQPLVENCILHGVRGTGRKGYIKLRVYQHREYVWFHVTDNGKGMTPEELHALRDSIRKFHVHSIGLANVNNRLKLYYGEESCIRIYSRKDMGTALQFRIPAEKMKDADPGREDERFGKSLT